MSIKMVELDGDDMLHIIFMLAGMLIDVKKHPNLINAIPDSSEELVVRLLDIYVSNKTNEEKLEKTSEAAMREFLAKVSGK